MSVRLLSFILATCLVSLCQPCIATGQTKVAVGRSAPRRIASAQPAENAKGDQQKAKEWFADYDQARRDAEMTTAEKFAVRSVLKKGISLTSKEADRARAKDFASLMVTRYANAGAKLSKMDPPTPEIKNLQDGYSKYFSDGKDVFETYLKAQQDIIKTGIKEGDDCSAKQANMKILDRTNKELDRQLRSKYRIAPHKHR